MRAGSGRWTASAPLGQNSWQQKQRMHCARRMCGRLSRMSMAWAGQVRAHRPQPTHFCGKRSTGREHMAARMNRAGFAVRAGLHCAPLAHESAGTAERGTVRVSFGHQASDGQTRVLLDALARLP